MANQNKPSKGKPNKQPSNTPPLTIEEQLYIERAYMEYGFFKCMGKPTETLIRVGKLLAHGNSVELNP